MISVIPAPQTDRPSRHSNGRPHRVIADLNAQWGRLTMGVESASTVTAALDAWRRTAALQHVTSLADAIDAITASPNEVLSVLVARAKAGDHIATRTVVQALLPKLVRLTKSQLRAGHDFEEVFTDALGSLWDLAVNYPLSRPGPIAANLALDTLKALRSSGSAAERPVADCDWILDAVTVGSAPPQRLGGSQDDELGDLLDRATLWGVIRLEDAELIRQVYCSGTPAVDVAETLGVTGATLRQRCCRIKAKLREHANDLAA